MMIITTNGSECCMMRLAETTRCPKILEKLARHESDNVRNVVAKNVNTSKATLSKLAKDENWIVRLNVAINSNTSKATLSELAKDESVNVQRTAKRYL